MKKTLFLTLMLALAVTAFGCGSSGLQIALPINDTHIDAIGLQIDAASTQIDSLNSTLTSITDTINGVKTQIEGITANLEKNAAKN